MAPQPNFSPEADTPFSPERVFTPHVEIARLAALHDEARETALLANLLGRAPYVAAALAAAAVITAWFNIGAISSAEIGTWLVLMLIGVGAMARAYRQAIAAPFERASLRNFAADLTAIMIYLGFAWGAGAYLALSGATPPLALVLFAAVPAALVAFTLRQRDSAFVFVAPVTALAAFAAVLRPLPEGPLTAAFVLIACAAVGGAIFWIDRQATPSHAASAVPELALF